MPHTQIPSEMGGRFIPDYAWGDERSSETDRAQSQGKDRKNKLLKSTTEEAMGRFRDYEEELISHIDRNRDREWKGLPEQDFGKYDKKELPEKSALKDKEQKFEIGSQKLPKVTIRKPSTTDQYQTGHGKK